MPVSILQWSAEIGIFKAKLVKCPLRFKYWANVCTRNLNKFYTICCLFLLLWICAGDVEYNPGPRKNNTSYYFSFCHWNLNSIAAHTFSKLSLLEAYNIQNKIHMFSLSKTFSDSSIPPRWKILDERVHIGKSWRSQR